MHWAAEDINLKETRPHLGQILILKVYITQELLQKGLEEAYSDCIGF